MQTRSILLHVCLPPTRSKSTQLRDVTPPPRLSRPALRQVEDEVEPKYGVSAQGHAPQTAPVTSAGRMKITELESHMGDLVLLCDLPPLELLARLVVEARGRMEPTNTARCSAAEAASSAETAAGKLASLASLSKRATSNRSHSSTQRASLPPLPPAPLPRAEGSALDSVMGLGGVLARALWDPASHGGHTRGSPLTRLH